MSRGKRFKKKECRFKILTIKLIQIILLCIMILSGWKIFNWYKENKKSSQMLRDISNVVTVDQENNEYTIDFAKLKETNNETVGWIKVNGTEVDYPVVKTRDNDYYLTHGFDKSYNSAGWVFADYKNKFDGKDRNIVIFGHNRRDGSMFGTLKNILNQEWYNSEENLDISFITETEKITYRVFSIYKIEKEDYYITTGFNNEEFKTYIKTVKERSIKDFQVDVDINDKLLTLSTCDNNNKYRVVLHAKKII